MSGKSSMAAASDHSHCTFAGLLPRLYAVRQTLLPGKAIDVDAPQCVDAFDLICPSCQHTPKIPRKGSQTLHGIFELGGANSCERANVQFCSTNWATLKGTMCYSMDFYGLLLLPCGCGVVLTRHACGDCLPRYRHKLNLMPFGPGVMPYACSLTMIM